MGIVQQYSFVIYSQYVVSKLYVHIFNGYNARICDTTSNTANVAHQ